MAPDDDDLKLDGDVPDDEQEIVKVSYEITSFGSDPEVESLVGRLRKGNIVIPPFQRNYVWRQPEASRFVESLLLGLPVPGVFLAVDPATNKQVVLDGQQRLKTLQFYLDGVFNPKEGDVTQRVFKLTKVQPQFEGKSYAELEESDRIRLDTSVIHATVIRQTAPDDDDTSLFHVFERLNSVGTKLSPQEMRVALYHGKLVDTVKALNQTPEWRKIFGKINNRLKDQELIIRFFALFENHADYSRPMSEFLNRYVKRNRTLDDQRLATLSDLFVSAVSLFDKALPEKPFRLTNAINVSVFDSCMVGIANRLVSDPKNVPTTQAVANAYEKLLKDDRYLEAVSRSTADDAFVKRRVNKAIDAFSKI